MISDNVHRIRERIGAACRIAGRDPSDVTLVAVSKTFSANEIEQAVRAGITDIGENYVQELLKKRERLQGESIRWHFIGHLQSNKVKHLADWIHLIHSVDNVKLAAEVDKRAAAVRRQQELLVEVNTTGEPSKYGVSPDHLLQLLEQCAALQNIMVVGLMTIGPFLPNPEQSRPMFRELQALYERAGRLGLPNVAMRHLSMGMTGDFEVAIQEGATIVRIGTAIFGPRQHM